MTEVEEDTARKAYEGLRSQPIQYGTPEWGIQALPELLWGPRANDRSEDTEGIDKNSH